MTTSARRSLLYRALPCMALGLYLANFAYAAPEPLPEVTVIGKMDSRAVNHAVTEFIQSHAKPSAIVGQIGRWTTGVCPKVTGLRDAYSKFVSQRITSVARSIGAPVPAAAKRCIANIDVAFTPEPQALLDHIAKKYRLLLGYSPTSHARDIRTIDRPVQAWYMTGTRREMDGYQIPHCIGSPRAPCNPPSTQYSGDLPPFFTGLQIDSDPNGVSPMGGPIGTAGSYLTHDLRSEFVHVLVIADSRSVAAYSLQSVSDYIAVLALTRIASLDTCSELPSIVNIFASHCDSPPAAITTSDLAYLRALYGADLDKNLNVEEGDIHVRMVDAISRKR